MLRTVGETGRGEADGVRGRIEFAISALRCAFPVCLTTIQTAPPARKPREIRSKMCTYLCYALTIPLCNGSRLSDRQQQQQPKGRALHPPFLCSQFLPGVCVSVRRSQSVPQYLTNQRSSHMQYDLVLHKYDICAIPDKPTNRTAYEMMVGRRMGVGGWRADYLLGW